MAERVVVTGIGIVSPLGSDKDVFFRRLCAGESGIAETPPDGNARFSQQAALVRDFVARDHISLKNLRRMDRLSQMATAASRMALQDAGIVIEPANRDRIGIILGTSFGPTDVIVQYANTLFTQGPAFVNPILVPNTVMNAPAGHASIELGFRGINTTVNHYAVSAEIAIAYAASEIRRRRADCLLAGGADIASPFLLETLRRFRALSPLDGAGPEGARPFDRLRNGCIAGEGCGILCLESMSAALARGRMPYAEIAGWGMASAPTAPSAWDRDPDGVLRAASIALQAASLPPSRIDVFVAAANGGAVLDDMECRAYERMFGSADPRPRITASKGAVGEGFSTGGLRSAALALSLSREEIPPVAGLSSPLRPLPFLQGKAERGPCRYGLLDGISFGGTFVCLVMKKIRGNGT